MKKLMKNRIVIGLVCIILSLVICFGLTPMFNNALKSKVQLVRVNTEIHKGDQITEKMLTMVETGGYNLPGNVVCRLEDVVGRYANADLYKGDYILESKLSDTPMLKNAYLSKLNGENLAISVSIKSFAAGLSGKLEAGDIVTLIASDVGERRETLVLPELKYVEIIGTGIHHHCACHAGTGQAPCGTGTDGETPCRPGVPWRQHAGRQIPGGTAEGAGGTVCGRKCGGRCGERERGGNRG